MKKVLLAPDVNLATTRAHGPASRPTRQSGPTALMAARRNKRMVTQAEFKARTVMMGAERKSPMTEEELLTAYPKVVMRSLPSTSKQLTFAKLPLSRAACGINDEAARARQAVDEPGQMTRASPS